jgi:hypothetical protein
LEFGPAAGNLAEVSPMELGEVNWGEVNWGEVNWGRAARVQRPARYRVRNP